MDERRAVGEGEEEEALLARFEADLARWLAIEPSPSFKAGVRRRIFEAERPAGRFLRWLWPAGAAGGAALAVAIALRPTASETPAPAIPPAVATAPSLPPAGPRPAVAAKAPVERPRDARPARKGAVIVPPGEARKIEAYYGAVMLQVSLLPAAADELTIAPLEIEPLPGSVESAPAATGGIETASEEET